MWLPTIRSRSLPMSATYAIDSTAPAAPVLYLAIELGWNVWKLAFTIGAGQKPRLRPLPAQPHGPRLGDPAGQGAVRPARGRPWSPRPRARPFCCAARSGLRPAYSRAEFLV